jgi:hypothetical protein
MRRILFGSVCVIFTATQTGSQEPEKTAEVQAVKQAIRRGVEYLKKQHVEAKGWEAVFPMRVGDYNGGSTGLVCLAMLEAGENPDQGELKQGLDYLRGVKTRKTYVLGLRLAALARVVARGGHDADRRLMQTDRDTLLQDAVRDTKGKFEGWSYPASGGMNRADFSNTHFALLGLHAAQQAGVETAPDVWREVRELYVRSQGATGGWGYHTTGEGGSRLTMTFAGLAGIGASSQHLKEKAPESAVANAVKFAERFYVPNIVVGPGSTNAFPYYNLFALSRGGPLAGVKQFRDPKGDAYDWYAATAKRLLELQGADGSWKHSNAIIDGYPGIATSMTVIFLARGGR